MTAISASTMLIAAVGLMITAEPFSRRSLGFGRVAGAIILGLGAFALLEYTVGFATGIDRLLPFAPHAIYAARPSPQTSLGFVLMGAGMLGMYEAKAGWPLFADISVLMLVGLDMVMFGGHLYNALDLVGISGNTLMAPQTLLCISCLTFALVCRRARHGRLLAVLVNHGIGSRIVRMILPAALLMPYAIFGLVAFVTRAHALSAPYARAIAAATSAFLILCVITWMGWRINAMERELRDLSLTDELTGVYNRRGFYFIAQQILRDDARTKSGVSLFFFDLNDLKAVNDMLGHEAGSDTIQAFAAILRKTFRSNDIISRVGGDEFAVLMVGAVELREIVSRLEQNAHIFNTENNKHFSLSFSLGFTQMKPEEPESLDDMMARADGLMYADKVRRKAAQLAASA